MIWAAAACLFAGAATALDWKGGVGGGGARAPPRIIIEQTAARTGGPEALLQLLIACADAGLDCYWFGEPPGFQKEYRNELDSHALLPKNLSLESARSQDVIIQGELHKCMPLGEGVRPHMWLLAQRNLGPDACPRLSHNHHLATLPGVPVAATLTPYISPAIVEHAKEMAGLQPDGTFRNVGALLAQKKRLVLVDADSWLMPYDMSKSLWKALGLANMGAKVVTADHLTRERLLQVMLEAKVVVDLCMRGSERLPLEAALHGAVVITDRCKTGEDTIDVPLDAKHKAGTVQAFRRPFVPLSAITRKR